MTFPDRVKKAFCHLLLLGILFAFQTGTGRAQEQMPTETYAAVEQTGTLLETEASPIPTLPTQTVTPSPTAPVETPTATYIETAETIIPTPSVEAQTGFPGERIMIKITTSARLEKVMERTEAYGRVIENTTLEKLGVFILEVPADRVEEKISELRNISGVAWVEPDHQVQALDTFPNDPSFPSQYALIAIRAPQGWDTSTGSSSVTIAILDSGVDLGHPDLAGKIAQGFDFVNDDNDPQDDYGHGTHAAGIAGAIGNNGIGIAGVSWGAHILPVKVLDATGSGKFSNVAAGIVWATDRGAQVINMSFGGADDSQILQDAVRYAYERGVLMIAASGNSNTNFVLYPARFSEVMAVAATDASDQRASFSNYGGEIEIAAPGANILSLWPGGYNTLSGTSMSAPHVSGLAAILFGLGYDSESARQQIKASALDIPPDGQDIYTGFGLIQMDFALQLLPSPTATVQSVDGQFSPPVQLPTLTWTITPGMIPTSATVTRTATLQAAPSASSTPTVGPTKIPEVTPTPATGTPAAPGRFRSPYLCGGIVSILLGILAFLLYRRNASHK